MNCTLSIGGVSLREYYYTPPEASRTPAIDKDTLHAARSQALNFTFHYRLTVTENGYLGLAPTPARKGDKICILLGCSVSHWFYAQSKALSTGS